MSMARRLIRNIVAWAVVEDDGANRGPVPVQQIRSFDQSGRAVEWYPYGFFATARAGSPALRFLLSGADAVAHIPGSPEDRPAHASGEVGVYHPETGSFVIFRADGSVEVEAKADLRATVGGAATIEAGTAVTITAAATVTLDAPSIVLATGPTNIVGNLDQDGALLGFRGSAPVAKPIINGTKTGGTAQNQLLQALELMGLIDDQT